MRQIVALCALCAPFVFAACEVEWSGAQIALEDPAPVEIVEEVPEEEVIVPLPSGPLLYRVEVDDEGAALVVPVARMADSLPIDMELPGDFDEAFRARFDSAFLAPGTELAVFADGRRVGSVLLGSAARTWSATCPSATEGTTLLVQGQELPISGFAVPLGVLASTTGAAGSEEPDRRMRTYGPVLTENILERRGYDRAFLAQRADIGTVRYGDDEGRAMYATYLVNDSLKPQAVGGAGVSLFFIARFERSRGYYPVWHEYRRYGSAEEREVFAYEGWFEVAPGRLDFLRLYGDGTVRLAASLERQDARERGIDWVEPERCQSWRLFSGAAAETASGPPPTPSGAGRQTPATQLPAAQTPRTRTPAAGPPAEAERTPPRQTEPDIQPRQPIEVRDTAGADQ